MDVKFFSKLNIAPVMMYVTYKQVFVVKLKFEFLLASKPIDISSNSHKLLMRSSDF
jgi:hypothetical protein